MSTTTTSLSSNHESLIIPSLIHKNDEFGRVSRTGVVVVNDADLNRTSKNRLDAADENHKHNKILVLFDVRIDLTVFIAHIPRGYHRPSFRTSNLLDLNFFARTEHATKHEKV